MDQIDINLLHAWNRISARVRADRLEALSRSCRRLTPTLTRPPRAWCLVIRASDTRISPYNTIITLDSGGTGVSPVQDGPTHRRDACATTIGLDESIESALARPGGGLPHSLSLDGVTIRNLCKPVMIPWPGIPTWEAARILGMSKDNARRWSKKGYLKIERYDPPQPHGKRGKPIPIVYTPSPIDTANFQGRPPDPIWGTLWQGLWEMLPENFTQTLRREPRTRPLHGKSVSRGWEWICPGRIGPDGKHEPCHRRCIYLYAPMPIWTIQRAMGVDEGYEVGVEKALGTGHLALGREGENPSQEGPPQVPIEDPPRRNAKCQVPGLRLAGLWHPGHETPEVGSGSRAFACKECWDVYSLSMSSYVGWNHFITYISGGLLYGHEVARPEPEAAYRRKKPHFTLPNRKPSKRQAEVLDLIIQGMTYPQIGERLGIRTGTVSTYAKKLLRKHNVHSRQELVAKVEKEREIVRRRA